MSREQSSINASMYYGPRTVDSLGTAIGGTRGVEKLVYEFDFDALPGTDANDAVVPVIPAGKLIKAVYVDVLTAVTGATDYIIGLSEADGTVIDADGLVTSGDSALTAGSYAGSGALVGTNAGEDGQLTFAFTGTATAGSFRVVVEYLS